jgi:hypothetical protein
MSWRISEALWLLAYATGQHPILAVFVQYWN